MKITIGRVAAAFGLLVALGLPALSRAREASNNAACTLPPGLNRVLGRDYAGMRVLTAKEMPSTDRSLFLKEHGEACPGFAHVDFNGDGLDAIAISLVQSKGKPRAVLVLATPDDGAWKIEKIDSSDSATPVVWTERSGHYEDVHGTGSITAVHPAIVWCEYEAWAILYARTGSTISKIWIAD